MPKTPPHMNSWSVCQDARPAHGGRHAARDVRLGRIDTHSENRHAVGVENQRGIVIQNVKAAVEQFEEGEINVDDAVRKIADAVASSAQRAAMHG